MNDTHCKISAATLARTAALALALTNQVLSACGKPMLPIESATVEQLVTTGLTVTAALVNWWKNNSSPRRPSRPTAIWNSCGKRSKGCRAGGTIFL